MNTEKLALALIAVSVLAIVTFGSYSVLDSRKENLRQTTVALIANGVPAHIAVCMANNIESNPAIREYVVSFLQGAKPNGRSL